MGYSTGKSDSFSMKNGDGSRNRGSEKRDGLIAKMVDLTMVTVDSHSQNKVPESKVVFNNLPKGGIVGIHDYG